MVKEKIVFSVYVCRSKDNGFPDILLNDDDIRPFRDQLLPDWIPVYMQI